MRLNHKLTSGRRLALTRQGHWPRLDGEIEVRTGRSLCRTKAKCIVYPRRARINVRSILHRVIS